MSDDLDMKALRGDIPSLAAAVVAAGCDLALNCWGRIEEMRGITEVLDEIRPESRIRLDRAMAPIAHTPEDQPLDELIAKRSEEHTSELQSLMRNSYAVFCLKTKKQN